MEKSDLEEKCGTGYTLTFPGRGEYPENDAKLQLLISGKFEGEQTSAMKKVSVKYYHPNFPGILIVKDLTIHRGQLVKEQIPVEMETRGESQKSRQGIFIESKTPISVFAVTGHRNGFGGTQILGHESLGNEYAVLCPEGPYPHWSKVVIAATNDNTALRIKFPKQRGNSTLNVQLERQEFTWGSDLRHKIHKFDVLQLESYRDSPQNGDLSGLYINASEPIADASLGSQNTLLSSFGAYVCRHGTKKIYYMTSIVSRLLFREELSGQMLQSLSLITLLPVPALKRLANQLAFGLHQLIRTNAADIHRRDDWKLLFVLLEISGAAAYPPHLTKDARTTEKTSSQPISGSAEDLSVRVGSSDTEAGSSRSPSVERGYTSDTEVGRKGSEWAYVDDKGEKVTKHVTFDSALSYNLAALELQANLHTHNPSAFLKCCETLAFIVRDAAHVTPENFESCLSCLRTFAEASLNGGRFHKTPSTHEHHVSPRGGSKKKRRGGKASSAEQALSEEKEAELKRLAENYHQVALQLLDLAHTLHVKVADMYYQWQAALPGLDTSAPALWKNAWCPLLQTLARFCCDNRKQIRNTALTYLQRALLIHDLHASEPAQWEQCFTQILFPLLAQLQRNVGLAQADPSGVEEAKCRALQLLSKVFLQHLNPLLSLEDFGALWATILEFNGQFYQSDEKGDVLLEAIPETMKNMLLVMETAGVFSTVPKLSQLTRDYVQPFLPNLLDELFPKEQGGPEQSQVIASSPESGGPAGHPGVPADKSCESASTEGNVHQSHQTCEHSDEDSQMVVIKPEDVETQGERVEIPQGAEMSHDELEEIVVDRPEPGRVPPASAASVFAHDVSPSQVILHPPTCGESGSSQDKNLSGLFSSTSTVLPSNVVLHPPSADTYFTRSPVTPDCKIDENSRPEAGGSPARSMKMEA